MRLKELFLVHIHWLRNYSSVDADLYQSHQFHFFHPIHGIKIKLLEVQSVRGEKLALL